jgi:hypothetical protein
MLVAAEVSSMVSKNQLAKARAEAADLNRKNKELERLLSEAQRAPSPTPEPESEPQRKKLERSSIEAYVGISVGIVLALVPMTWWLRIPLFITLGVMCADFCWRSPFSYKWPAFPRIAVVAVVLFLVGKVGLENVSQAYADDMFPPNVDYIRWWGDIPGQVRTVFYADQNGKGGRIEGSTEGQIIADGTKMGKFAKKYKLWAALYHNVGFTDAKDAPASGSAIFDISADLIYMKIPWSDEFKTEVERQYIESEYSLVLIPIGVPADSFRTVRDAVNHGGILLQTKGGPP